MNSYVLNFYVCKCKETPRKKKLIPDENERKDKLPRKVKLLVLVCLITYIIKRYCVFGTFAAKCSHSSPYIF